MVEGALRGLLYYMRWVEGPPKIGWEAPRSEQRVLVAHRCAGCGRLELYANGVLEPGVPTHPSWENPPPFE
jgi:hypothetical protein